jgi:hypothetical protein
MLLARQEADASKVLTADEARKVDISAPKLPGLLRRED